MREKLNSNPMAQMALLGVLLLVVGFFVMSSMGGGEEEAETEAPAATATAPEGEEGLTVTAPGEEGAVAAAPGEVPPLPPSAVAAAPPLPAAVTEAFEADRIVVLLFVSNGGIDDRTARHAVAGLSQLSGVSTFVVPARRIARYAAIAQGLAISRVPALVVLRPKHLTQGVPSASVQYGFQSPESAVQAVIDAGYEGQMLDYHP
ncbi:MAG TPA: hypothetical protein VGV69_10145 [Solirubrobacterales bacterium]|nr:hypothetical protein [Solirubrobacterales bacterium]